MRNKILDFLANIIPRYPWWSGLVLLLITILFGAMAGQLSMKTSFTDLMPEDEPMVEEFDRIIDEFDGAMSMLVVAEGNPLQLVKFAEAAAPEIEALKHYFKKVDYRLPKDLLTDHALMLMKTKELLANRIILEDPNLTGYLKNLNETIKSGFSTETVEPMKGQELEQGLIRFMDGIQTLSEEMSRAVNGDTELAGTNAVDAILFGDSYYRSWDRQMLIMQIIPSFDWLEFESYPASTYAAEDIVKKYAKEFGVEAGLTGAIPLQRDELRAIENDSFTITSIALLVILVLFIVAFRMFVSPVLAIITLLIGVTWAMGITWLVVGQLNMMTAMMGVILVGLGIDFSIHIIAVFTEMRAAGNDIQASMKTTMNKAAIGVITGGFTTAAAFFTFMFTRTAGFREFGLSLGVGIIMTMVAAITVLPTMLVIRERILLKIRKGAKVKPPRDISYKSLGKGAGLLAKHPGFTMAVVIVLILFIGWRGSKITWDYNYLNMEPVGLETVILQEKMIKKMGLSSDYGYLTADNLEEATELTQKARKMETAGLIRSIVDFLPPEEEQEERRSIVAEIRENIQSRTLKQDFSQEDLAALKEQIYVLADDLKMIQTKALESDLERVYLKSALLIGGDSNLKFRELNEDFYAVTSDTAGALMRLAEQLEELGTDGLRNLSKFSADFGHAFKKTALRMANTDPVTLETIPENIRKQYVGESGDLFLITIYPNSNVWDQLFLNRFSDELEGISPRATGLPPVYRNLINYFSEDGKFATKLALVVIFIILLLDFRNVRKAALAIVPLAIGALWMLGVMELSGLQLTMMNAMAVPLIIGIGIDDGVHIIHRYQIEGNKGHKTVFASTGRAVLLTSLTTMLGFGSLTFATYRGLGSMGISLFIGVGTCFLATILVIPAIMGIVARRKSRR